MKKFLSLVLALVMTMSLVTIGAGATEYKDLKDKSEIQYEEAVAVLNKIGIITGYEDGSFKPTGALTRGAAAKIIVSLMIGSEAASSLTVAAAPYKDVPVTNTFAAVISYCKTAGYINGYSDGTFRPTASLTGYAFAKMLLGALGYDGKIEGFTGNGWTMNVARIGNEAGLYNDFKETFAGNAGVTREQACQLALNTLKATVVEYVGGTSVVAGDASVTINAERQYKTSNDGKINQNISDKKTGNANSYYTLEFGEEHFRDLKLVGDTTTDFDRPATQWSYKNVTIGKFAYAPDFSFTAGTSGDTNKEKVKNLGLNSYKLYKGTKVSINEKDYTISAVSGKDETHGVSCDDATVSQTLLDLFGNGVLVEIYLDDDYADLISNIVVIRTQLMEVNTVSSKTITLKKLDEVGDDADKVLTGKLYKSIASIKDTDDVFGDLKSAKSGDYMLVTYTGENTTKDAYSAKAPTVVTGALTAVSRNNSNEVNGVTVGGTAYKLAAVRDDDFATLNASTISSSKKDVTLYLDAYGYATYIKDAGSSSNFMIYGDTYTTLVNGKLVTTMTGWDMKGAEVSVTVKDTASAKYGDLVKYTTNSGNASYDYIASTTAPITVDDPDTTKDEGVKGFVNVFFGTTTVGAPIVRTDYEIKAGDTTVPYDATHAYTVASGVKTIFVDYNDDNTVKSVYVKNGVANVTNDELKKLGPVAGGKTAEMYVNGDGGIEAIIVKTTSSDAVSDKVLYVESVKSDSIVDGVRTYTYHVWVNGAEDDYTSTDNLSAGLFATYAEGSNGNYKLSAVTKTDSATSSFKLTIDKGAINTTNKNLIYGINKTYMVSLVDINKGKTTDLAVDSTLNTTGAVFADLKDKGFASMKDVYDYLNSTERTAADDQIELTFVMNNKDTADDYLKVTAIAVTGIS